MALFVDVLDIELMLLGGGLLVLAYWVLLNFTLNYDQQKLSEINRGFGYFFLTLGIYSLAMGLWSSFVWPLPSSYNLVLSDPFSLYGIALIALGFANIYKVPITGVLAGIAILSIPVINYGAAILHFGMTNSPTGAGALYLLIGINGLLSPILQTKAKKYWSYIAILLLVLAAILALYTGIAATYEHIEGWRSWAPFYG
ncbi:putative membrane protein [Caldisphaera lagunensis DSM 15908]|uniref:Putative membrane protein n=1 Tax=Caldisphaera lagunensis (strain DSM 15908 / JCM 11604 / ANMR 0165 / IC-154) TaxID=1056495 RepID=L0A9I0_CALLD|nr:DUF981 domain-containing protein [Caldisphaera lagunensis]AFZ70526.1 putative membrane protein [Caldisphaera lagunensis DSM 15908]